MGYVGDEVIQIWASTNLIAGQPVAPFESCSYVHTIYLATHMHELAPLP